MLGNLLVIGRQYIIPNVGKLDLLCIDETGTLVVVEFKRDLTSREAVAQILDYASWLDLANEEDIKDCASEYLENKSLEDAFSERFNTYVQGLTPQKHRMLLVAPKLDASAERIINYLAERYDEHKRSIFSVCEDRPRRGNHCSHYSGSRYRDPDAPGRSYAF